MKENYTIKHTWGDPREPEYKNGMQIFSVIYKEEKKYFHFGVTPIKKDDGRSVGWVIQAPKNLGISFGGNKDKYMAVCNLVVEYLKKGAFNNDWRMKDRDFSDVYVDISAIPSWRSIRIEMLKEKYKRPLLLFPKRPQLAIFVAGVTAIYANEYVINIDRYSVFRPLLFTFGCLSILVLFFDIVKEYKFISGMLALANLGNRRFKLRETTLKTVFIAWGARYLITFCLALVLLCYAGYA